MPGIALLEAAAERFPGFEATFFRTRRTVEDTVLGSAGLPGAVTLRPLDLPSPGRGPLTLARFALRCLRAVAAVRAEIRRLRPEALVALGGWPSVPGIVAALREGTPLVLLEQNRIPGKVVRFFAGRAAAVACPDGASADLLRAASPRARPRVTGNPVRRSVVAAARARRERAPAAPGGPRTVLVVGGSQGARGINRAIAGALPDLREHRRRISWIHVAGAGDRDAVAAAYREDGWDARVFDYTPDLPALLAVSDLAVTRAGGTIVSEIAAIGVPAVLVPYPHHRDRHQALNAAALVEAGAALLAEESTLTPAAVTGLIENVLFDDGRLRSMEEAALSEGRPAAAEEVLDLIVDLSHRKAGGT
jgi:UDP-N-acetylglucosamine--N-acetylmuramyl-(pentapeptide) pyrophosphoryl-undecaprenol N-acetylglucosamine transferase